MLDELVRRNRTYRRFYQDVQIERGTLEELVDLARLSSSGGNHQALKYLLSWEEERNRLIYPHLRWAGYLNDWDGPQEGERPPAYIIVLGDHAIRSHYFWDHGLASQSILLGACEKGLGGCMFGSINKKSLAEDLRIPVRYEILLVIALGKPKETVVLEEMSDQDEVKYWRDAAGIHHVPKRKLQDILVEF
jgi:nitroreductase